MENNTEHTSDALDMPSKLNKLDTGSPISSDPMGVDGKNVEGGFTSAEIYEIVKHKFPRLTFPMVEKRISSSSEGGSFFIDAIISKFERETDRTTPEFRIKHALHEFRDNPYELSTSIKQGIYFLPETLHALMSAVQSDLPPLRKLRNEISPLFSYAGDLSSLPLSFNKVRDYFLEKTPDRPAAKVFHDACTQLETVAPVEKYAVAFTPDNYLQMGVKELDLVQVLSSISNELDNYSFCEVYKAGEGKLDFQQALRAYVANFSGETFLLESSLSVYDKNQEFLYSNQICLPYHAKKFLGVNAETIRSHVSKGKLLPLVQKGRLYFSGQNIIDLQKTQPDQR